MGRLYTFFVGAILTGLGLGTRVAMPQIREILAQGSSSGVESPAMLPISPGMVQQSTVVFIGIGALAMGYATLSLLIAGFRSFRSWKKRIKSGNGKDDRPPQQQRGGQQQGDPQQGQPQGRGRQRQQYQNQQPQQQRRRRDDRR